VRRPDQVASEARTKKLAGMKPTEAPYQEAAAAKHWERVLARFAGAVPHPERGSWASHPA